MSCCERKQPLGTTSEAATRIVIAEQCTAETPLSGTHPEDSTRPAAANRIKPGLPSKALPLAPVALIGYQLCFHQSQRCNDTPH